MYIEPLLLLPSTNVVSNWIHPDIEKLVEDFDKKKNVSNTTSLDYYTGTTVGFRVYFDNGLNIDIIVLTDEEGITAISKLKEETHFVKQLIMMLTCKDWSPGGKTFTSTDYGIIFNKIYSMQSQHFDLDIFDDITITTNGIEWWFI